MHRPFPVASLHTAIVPVMLSLLLAVAPRDIAAQQLDSLHSLARRGSPVLRAAQARVDATRALVAPAGALADPMLMAGIVNVPLGGSGGSDMMTMKMIGIEQTIPHPGKRSLRRDVATQAAGDAMANRDWLDRTTMRDVTLAYLDVAEADSMLRLLRAEHQLLGALAQATEGGYAAGVTGQQDPLRAQVEMLRLSGAAAELAVMRAHAVARLNALLDQAPMTPLPLARFPARLLQSAAPAPGIAIPFTDTTFGALVGNSPFLPVDTLHHLVATLNPRLLAARSNRDAQVARVRLAERDARPDATVSLQYGQRDGRSDMISALIRIPLAIRQGTRQRAVELAEREVLDALGADELALAAALRVEVHDAAQDAELHRTRLVLFHHGILPRARAAAAAALAGYRAGSASFETVLGTYLALFRDEAETVRALADFSRAVTVLEALVGLEVIS
ncbi:MAG: TolC family protein [Gemmatimonadales bacterium]|nr:TolC family protein [Gemmatimonadales bacterium]